jgi:hypothetical protein
MQYCRISPFSFMPPTANFVQTILIKVLNAEVQLESEIFFAKFGAGFYELLVALHGRITALRLEYNGQL